MPDLKTGVAALAAACALATAPHALAQTVDERIDYPDGFRGFTHITTGIVTPDFFFNGVDLGAQVPGLHNIYANRSAMVGYRRLAGARPGRVLFPEGSVIAFDLWQTGTLPSEAPGAGTFTFQQKRLAVAVMEKDRQKYAATGGWGFQVFVDKVPQLDAKAQEACFACHRITPGTDFVFSKFSD